MKKRNKGELGSLDSLLDTMTTVVGILIILLIVVQFDVEETVQRIVIGDDSDLPKVTTEQIEALRKDVDAKVTASAQAAEKIPELKGLLSSTEFRLERMNAKLLSVQQQLKKSTDTEKAMDELSVLMKSQQKTISEMEQDIADKQALLERMYEKIEEEPDLPLPKATSIRLPDPKPAPEGARGFYVLCVGNKLYPVNWSELHGIVKKGVEQSRAKKNEKGEIDGEAVVSFFRRVPIGNRHFRIEAQVRNHRLRFVLHRKRLGGEDARMIRADLSEFQKMCKAWDKQKSYMYYVIWPDSFNFYHRAREISGKYGIPAGWRPTERKELYASSFGEYFTFGYHKNKPKSNDDKAPPKPQPKPTSVID